MGKTTTETPRKKKRWTFWRLAFMTFVWSWAVLLLGIVAAAALAFIVYDHVTREGQPGAPVEITVPEGASGRDVGQILAENKLIEHEGFFRLAIQLKKVEPNIQHGAYELPRGLSAMQLLELLMEGPSSHLQANQVRITIPEGLSIPQAAALTSDPEAFIEAAQNPEFIARLGINAATLEGFLMPNTYFFDTDPHPQLLVKRMVSQFEAEWDALLAENPGAAGVDKLYLVTVASLIEREAKVEEERPLISQVIYNRLEEKMKLQMDSTLQFALNKYGQRMLDADKDTRSPYNTYQHAGLPPGPICSPGLASLRAAMAPADVPYLYFVSNADGKTHTFSRTLAEHNRAVQKYNREIAPQREAQQKR
jgi:UPF0755 protein